MSHCFMDWERVCSCSCIAHVKDGKTNCRILNTFERLVPLPTRPVPPTPPKAGT